MFHELCNIRQAEQIGGLNLLGDEFNLKHEIVVVKEISHKSNLLCCFGKKYTDKTSFVCQKKRVKTPRYSQCRCCHYANMSV